MPPHQKALGTQQQPGLGITSAMVLLLYQKWAGVITFGATLTVCNYLLHLVPCQLVLAPTRKKLLGNRGQVSALLIPMSPGTPGAVTATLQGLGL